VANKFFLQAKSIAELLWYEERKTCLLCGKQASTSLCQDCRQLYFRPEQRRCLSCGKLIEGEADRCQDCRDGNGPKFLSKVTALGHYEGAWKQCIHNIKYKGQPYLLIGLAEYLTSWAVKQLPPPDSIVPVPLHPNRLAQRGFNQAEVLASVLAGCLGIKLKDILCRVKDTTPQSALGRQERLVNLRCAFSLKPGIQIKEEVIWLVDDVVTTAATIGECAAVLKESGAQEVFAFCLGAGRESSNNPDTASIL
jgi:competence protein ComFC